MPLGPLTVPLEEAGVPLPLAKLLAIAENESDDFRAEKAVRESANSECEVWSLPLRFFAKTPAPETRGLRLCYCLTFASAGIVPPVEHQINTNRLNLS